MSVIDEAGNRYGRLLVLTRMTNDKYGNARWLCQCRCGIHATIGGGQLRNGHTRSCGCLKIDSATTHGKYYTPEYRAWTGMIQRCTNPRAVGFINYGSRGIGVCQEWRESFEAFYADMGSRTSSLHSLERIDNDAGYSPDNCRWATRKEQMNNRRKDRLITLTCQGETKPLIDWAQQLGIKKGTLRTRIDRGWTHERALSR